MQSIVYILRQWYDIHYVGIGYKGPIIHEQGLTIYPCNLHGGDVYGAYQARALVEQQQPVFVLLLSDLWMLHNYAALSSCQPRPHIMAYVPLDGRIADPAWFEPLSFIDQWVAYNRFAQHEIDTARMALTERERPQRPLRKIAIIPHGVDTHVFYPLEQHGDTRAVLKRQVFPTLVDAEQSFVVLNANRPQPRKRIDLTIAGFARFARNKPDTVRLCLHHAIMDARERRQILDQAEQCDIRARLILSPEDTDDLVSADDTALNQLYNACDVGLNTAMGEGWGLISFEHAATGAAQIVPRHSACAELWENRAVLVEPVSRGVPAFSPLEMAEVSAQDVAEALELLYQNTEQRKQLANAGYQYVTQAAFQWPTIAGQWRTLFQTVSDHVK